MTEKPSNEELLKRVQLWGKVGTGATNELVRRIIFENLTWEQLREYNDQEEGDD